MKARIKFLRQHLALNQREFSARINISQPTLALMEKGQRVVRDIHVAQICSEFNINEKWLRTGEGEMFLSVEVFSLDEQAKKSNLTELEIAIMRGYMNLDLDVREKLMNELEAIFKPIHNEDIATFEDNGDSAIEAEMDIANDRKDNEDN
ncbi:helix-turn-helix transcriptional regulator [Metasolibacillus meyeri]|uniref:Helix-turn-helix transcriptional regulator n=1 Tax=Metasolibacillus meyeri TaxID=1071052 RepID=A0AAW9NLM7_9BACL|nr:helix-turn-helix transcriptional regulator [Metasolibacillus meyeri]MEC1177417.1 helix-turn-helix transcriptional regulator [Metasolibacillus meyeri]